MVTYTTLTQALTDLNKRGFVYDFNLQENSIYCPALQKAFDVENFNVVEYHRFDGDSNYEDLAEAFAIETTCGIKGVLTDSAGYAAALSPAIIAKLKFRP
jgi:hypothetical protein